MKWTIHLMHKNLHVFSFMMLALCLAFSACSSKTEKERALDDLREGLADIQRGLPEDWDEGLILEGVELSGDFLVCTFEFPEEQLQGMSLGTVVKLRPEVKTNLKSALKEHLPGWLESYYNYEAADNVMNLCRKAGVGFKCRFRGSHSGKWLEIEIPAAEW